MARVIFWANFRGEPGGIELDVMELDCVPIPGCDQWQPSGDMHAIRAEARTLLANGTWRLDFLIDRGTAEVIGFKRRARRT